MDERYEEIKFILGSTIEQAVNELSHHKNEGKLVCGVFNGITLYSDTVTMDSAYLAITGKSKAEFDAYVKSLRR